MSIFKTIEKITQEFKNELESIKDSAAVEELRLKYLSRKGIVADLFKEMGKLIKDEKPAAGKAIQDLKKLLETDLEKLSDDFKTTSSQKPKLDLTLPGLRKFSGGLHPLTIVEQEVISIFKRMGFSVERGPEIESTLFNFDMLNTPEWHPARDETDTFYFDSNTVLRTETSPVQIRGMLKKVPPVRFIAPGRVYRNDKPDPTHTPMFSQVEGLYLDYHVTFADLKGTLFEFYKALFGKDTVTRFRPHYFPFTEPSAEVDVSCFFCKGQGCRVCKNSGWLEMGGSGMVHPNVLRSVCRMRGDNAYDPEKINGYAFGLGIERIAMLKFGVNDIRLFYENDLRFIAQFS